MEKERNTEKERQAGRDKESKLVGHRPHRAWFCLLSKSPNIVQAILVLSKTVYLEHFWVSQH